MSLTNNRISKVAIVGAGGNSGRFIAEALVAHGKHTVTALTRPDSTSTIPDGIRSVVVDYNDKDALVAALRGQDALIITLSVTAPPVTHDILVEAAAAAGVPWILPNEWGGDTTGKFDTSLLADIPSFALHEVRRKHIASLGVSSYIGVATGFWYEWSLAMAVGFGFDFASRKVTFFDDGKTLMSISTWPQVGRAVAALLSLPVESEGTGASLSDYRNQQVYVASFTVSQQDMFESVLRVTGDKREDWTIEYETSRERFERGAEDLKRGDRIAFARMLYGRAFYPVPGGGNTEKTRGLINDALGLQKEDIDEATRRAIHRAQTVKPFGTR